VELIISIYGRYIKSSTVEFDVTVMFLTKDK
jgi:hypothetical protein